MSYEYNYTSTLAQLQFHLLGRPFHEIRATARDAADTFYNEHAGSGPVIERACNETARQLEEGFPFGLRSPELREFTLSFNARLMARKNGRDDHDSAPLKLTPQPATRTDRLFKTER